MPLTAGSRLGPYEILAPLGAGGMGEVYRARDAKLNRDVAIKVLPEAVANDPERMARFQREAQVLASLNHPHIAAIYGLEKSGSIEALVLELVEGETLADRIAAGPVPVDEALIVARQIADALEAAHEKGIVHRDLKPGNVKITPEGKVKVLDFGLAKALTGDRSSPDVSHSPTLTAAATQAGVVLGTAAYMSPEQARGKSVDKRADIWAFGAVLYEMLAGRKAFEGETVSDTLAAVLRADVDWAALPPQTPSSVRRVLRRCLDRDVKTRCHDIADARIEMDETPEPGAVRAPMVSGYGRRGPLLLALAAAVVLASVGWWMALRTRRSARDFVVRLNVALPRGQAVVLQDLPNFALSPDGTEIAYVARKESGKTTLFVRSIGSFDAKEFPDTESATAPFFSPDGQWLGYFVGERVHKMALSGGPPQPVCDTPVSGLGSAAWADDGSILVPSTTGGLMRAAPSGGKCEEIVKPDSTRGELMQPESLPGGKAILFAKLGAFQASQASVAVLDLKTGKSEVIISQGTTPHYVEPGFIVFGRSGAILAAPFDPKSLKLLGQPVPVVERVMPDSASGIEQFAVSRGGVLAYVAGTRTAIKRRIVMADRKGVSTTVTADSNSFEDLSLSPDGREIAMTVEGASWNIWAYHLDRGTLTRLTFENDNRDPLWTPDGKRVVYTSLRNGLYGLYWRLADGSGPEEQLFTSRNWMFASSWSPDGRFLTFDQQDPKTGFDIWILPMAGDRKSYPLVRSSFREWFGEFSRDGRWIAYESNESGRSEIYLSPFPGPGGKWQVSTEGGARPEWSRDGRELFFLENGKLMHVTVDSSHALAVGRPDLLFPCNCFDSGRYYDVTPDDKHFVFIQNAEPENPVAQINLVLGWGSELERQMREKRAR
ncbi:MAG TPA: protein kinase [Thermoanaerobaculia bacterium]